MERMKQSVESSSWIHGLCSLDIHGLVQLQYNSNSEYNFEVSNTRLEDGKFVHKQIQGVRTGS